MFFSLAFSRCVEFFRRDPLASVMQPCAESACDYRHDHPGQERYNTGIEDRVAEDEIPGPNGRTKRQIQNHRDWKDAEEGGDGHLPARRRIEGRAKPGFEPVELAIRGLAFG